MSKYTIITPICLSLLKSKFYSFMGVGLTPRAVRLELKLLLE